MITRDEYNKAFEVVIKYQQQVFSEYDKVKYQSGQIVPILPVKWETRISDSGLSNRVLRCIQDSRERYGLGINATLKDLNEIDFIKFSRTRNLGKKSLLEIRMLFARIENQEHETN
jgi:hypothetical protein